MKVRRFFLRLLPRLGIFVLSVLLLSVLTFYIGAVYGSQETRFNLSNT